MSAPDNVTPGGKTAAPDPVQAHNPADLVSEEVVTPGGEAAAPGPVQAHNPADLVPEEITDDNASEIGTGVASSTASVTSSVLSYREENGRKYHAYKEGKYTAPNDEQEQDRLDLQHNLFLLTFDNALGLAPPNQPNSNVQRVLDVGTGTGIWAIDFGEDHEGAEVLGIDLSHSMPEFVPPNVRFEIDDLDEEWTYSQPFDYIHTRGMNSCIADWRVFLTKVFDNLTPDLNDKSIHAYWPVYVVYGMKPVVDNTETAEA
ncbi:hypothetical protein CGMCC3_g9700 [Colletotrichum fructicola]|nr:uncharacterized protein CGMCC3_g9700 [Colletotrichum fructicola]KAE9574439.1 hypothetical protein CGMCC3_g9700 [Colletotrichum fructicola]